VGEKAEGAIHDLMIDPGDNHSDIQRQTAILAVEFWKLLRAFDRAISLAPEQSRKGLLAQARYAQEKLTTLTQAIGMRLVAFEGMPFEINLPAVAINGEDVAGASNLVIERTVEPAVIVNGGVLLTARVFVVAGQAGESGSVSRD
jgi:hypothetical protein